MGGGAIVSLAATNHVISNMQQHRQGDNPYFFSKMYATLADRIFFQPSIALCLDTSARANANAANDDDTSAPDFPTWGNTKDQINCYITKDQARLAGRLANKEVIAWKEMACVPGVSVCVMVRGQTVWHTELGYSDVENGLKVQPSTKMRIASISKSLTSSAMGILVDSGKLDLNDPIQKYLPHFPTHPDHPDVPITVRHLACHQSGIRHYMKGKAQTEFYSVQKYVSAKSDNPKGHPHPMDIFKESPWVGPDARPGQSFNYTTFGYTALGTVIEEAASQEFLSFMRRRVFDPSGMMDTFGDHPDQIITNRSKQYALIVEKPRETSDSWPSPNPQLVNAEYANSSYKWAGGGFVSTAQDLCKFGTSLISGRLVKRPTLEKLFTPQKLDDGKELAYGLGWVIVPNAHAQGPSSHGHRSSTSSNPNEMVSLKEKIVYHTGGAVGGSSVLVILPNNGVVVSVLANLENTRNIDGLGIRVANIFADNYHCCPSTPIRLDAPIDVAGTAKQ
ncbi:hypothetical protein SAMD00019534_072390 [Acytostelium subglobosum LB1]|uniref:hypothetical protein n=1 Tax=Acytostelium subglobosum LB1 TaxID=1410327 RepID=UPI0006447C73|nr:hypothetical protein SAMD00019534_072390 [Acytostelium subglobosum LB1]GAM24064.1 hypothetical protein SAMD00019534_072390 [Acytostelium subglobosum LB1]|eukprot:XP_012753100.1 hypothetical protein SAMD00019534_072390 [Acytostelium subglobosum LB1]